MNISQWNKTYVQTFRIKERKENLSFVKFIASYIEITFLGSTCFFHNDQNFYFSVNFNSFLFNLTSKTLLLVEFSIDLKSITRQTTKSCSES